MALLLEASRRIGLLHGLVKADIEGFEDVFVGRSLLEAEAKDAFEALEERCGNHL